MYIYILCIYIYYVYIYIMYIYIYYVYIYIYYVYIYYLYIYILCIYINVCKWDKTCDLVVMEVLLDSRLKQKCFLDGDEVDLPHNSGDSARCVLPGGAQFSKYPRRRSKAVGLGT